MNINAETTLGKMDNGSKSGAKEEVFNIGKREPGHMRWKKIQEHQANCIVQVQHIFYKSWRYHECLPAKSTTEQH